MTATGRSEEVRVGMVDGLVELRLALDELSERVKGLEQAWRRMVGCKLEVECEKTGAPGLLAECFESASWVGSRIQALNTATLTVLHGNVRALGKSPGSIADKNSEEGAK